ncbi:CSNK1A1 protein [Suillus discolor]|uniref:non-specific serine/threonine protein kinase n=1 Tax=Suillus discolor TaxID=1912936 RepID=A0A9P7F2P5_9AGAM|nr:CSNK1A1 protein [Suillus discolor]KAG2101612.1 CSNK1A1 protein [Suillus discolor]
MYGSQHLAVMYHAQNIITSDIVAVKLEPIIDRSSSVQRGVGIPCALWFSRESTYHTLVLDLLGSLLHSLFLAHNHKFSLHTFVDLADQLLSCLEYIHSHNYVHGDIKPQNVMVGLHDLRHTAFIIDFGITKEYCDTSTRLYPGHCDDLESLTYMLIYFLHGSLQWLTSDHEKLSSSSMLEHKANTTIEVLCHGIPVEFVTLLIYTCSLAFSEDLDYDHLCSLIHDLLDFSQSSDPVTMVTCSPPFSSECLVAEAVTPCLLKVMPPCRTHM